MMNRTFINKILTAALLASAALSMASCVAEEWEDCLDMRLLIKTDHDTGKWDSGTRARTRGSDIENWYNGIDSIDVYVFDENKKFVTIWAGGPYTSGVDYEVPLAEIGLPEGVYTFVAWTRTDENSAYVSNLDELLDMLRPGDPGEEGEEGEPEPEVPEIDFYLEDMRMNMSHPEGGVHDEWDGDLQHRHYGILERAYVSNLSILYPLPATIEISPSIHKVNFTVTGINSRTTDQRDDFTLTVIDSNTTHNFRNHYVPSVEGGYRQIRPLEIVELGENGFDENTKLITSMHLMQLDDASTTKVEIHNDLRPNEPIYVEENLRALIEMAFSANGQPLDGLFDEVLEFDVEMDLRAYPSKIEFNINGWRYIRITIDL